jgi:integrase
MADPLETRHAENPKRAKRAITAAEHEAVIASEKNVERKAYYEVLYETGAAQADAANLRAENIDWKRGLLIYRHQNLQTAANPRA